MLLIFISVPVLANPFLDIGPGDKCSLAHSTGQQVSEKMRPSVNLREDIFATLIEGNYLGYKARVFFTCEGDKLIGYSFRLSTAGSTEARELVKAWVPIIESKYGHPQTNTLAKLNDNMHKLFIAAGTADPDSVLVAWPNIDEAMLSLAVEKVSDKYDAVWAW